MRILMFGRGAIATVYGLALQEAGHDVEFYVRPGRAVEYGGDVQVDLLDARRAPLGRSIRGTFSTRLRESLEPADGFDLVVLSVSHDRLAEAATFLAPRIGEATVLVFGTVWDEPVAAVAPLPAERVVFGFPQGGGGFGDDGVLHAGVLRAVIIGRAGATPTARELAVQTAFRRAGFTVREERDMRGWLLLHFIADAGMFAQGVRSGGLARMIGDRRAFRDAFLVGRELVPVLEARGVDLRRHRAALLPFRHPAPVAAAVAWATVRIRIARVSLAAHTDPDAMEPRAVLRDVLRDTRRLGIAAPRLEAARRVGAGTSIPTGDPVP